MRIISPDESKFIIEIQPDKWPIYQYLGWIKVDPDEPEPE